MIRHAKARLAAVHARPILAAVHAWLILAAVHAWLILAAVADRRYRGSKGERKGLDDFCGLGQHGADEARSPTCAGGHALSQARTT
jgi:hypothetical protein